jgi:SMC interacting uncharacterized protein involved in chromosome segregation
VNHFLTVAMSHEILDSMNAVEEKIDELAQATAVGFNEVYEEIAGVREEMQEFRIEVRKDMQQLRRDMQDDMRSMFERYIVPLRTDHLALVGRVERLEMG